MSIAPMQEIHICALKKDRKPILETLQRIGVVEVSDLYDEDDCFKKINTENLRLVFSKNADIANAAVEIINKYTGQKVEPLSFFKGRKTISKSDYYTFVDDAEEIMRAAYKTVSLDKKINKNKAEISRLKMKKEALTPWLKLDISPRFAGTDKTSAFIGTFKGQKTESEIFQDIKEINPDLKSIAIEIVDASEEQMCVFILCKKEDKQGLETVLKNIGFAYLMHPPKTTAQKSLEKLNLKIDKMKSHIKKHEHKIKSYAGIKNALKFIVDYYAMRSQKYDVISKLLYSRNAFMLKGFVPKEKSKMLENVLTENFDVAIEVLNLTDQDNVPVLLKNNAFVSPVEPVVESYSLPGKNEVDPSAVMAVFYYIFFGIMLSDAAYGAITTLVCGFLLLKFKNLELNLKKSIKMFLFCGISTTFWGVMFGSYFGNATEVISQTFLDKTVTIPALWFTPLNEPMRMLAFSFGLGVLHLFAGLFLKLYQLVKIKHYKDAFCDVISWYFLVGGTIIYALSNKNIARLLALNFVLPAKIGTVALIFAVIGAVIIILTAGRESKNPFKRLLKGLYGLYGVTGYLSDIFSYSRLLALGLATGVIAQVFNLMGCIAGKGALGAIVFTVVFTIGHGMNIAINLLGAYVHTNRLQFVEFFSKFYEGGGRKFLPFFVNTKYYKITEDIVNG